MTVSELIDTYGWLLEELFAALQIITFVKETHYGLHNTLVQITDRITDIIKMRSFKSSNHNNEKKGWSIPWFRLLKPLLGKMDPKRSTVILQL